MANTADKKRSFGAIADGIESRKALVAVIGVGRVGLPLAVAAAEAGFRVVGLDPNKKLVERINRGNGAGYEDDAKVRRLVAKGLLSANSDPRVLSKCKIAVVCVPTPLKKRRELDIDYIEAASRDIAAHMKKPCLVILESTTYPGTTEEVIQPHLESDGSRAGKDFFLAHGPERLDPGNPVYGIRNTTKLVGGTTADCAKLAAMFYRTFVSKVRVMKGAKEAEMAKLFENVFRNVNIALVNEFVQICSRMGIDAHDVLDGAGTKEFGFMSFKPGPGVGGHCIPLDPYYLLWKSREFDVHPRFISLALEINENMPYYVADKLASALNDKGKCLKSAKIILLGITYKADTEDLRESPSVKVFEILESRGAKVSYHDPFCKTTTIGGRKVSSAPLTERSLRSCDAAIIATAHKEVDYRLVVKHAPLVLDTRRVLKDVKTPHGKVEWL